MRFDPLAPPLLLTADLPGIGGRIKAQPEDFEVEEIPAYEAAGMGDFLYLWIEKRDLGAEYFMRQVARRLHIPVGEVGAAGLKDRHGHASADLSACAAEERLAQLEGDGIRLLEVRRHSNKLKPGHLRGNRFRIVIRDADPQAAVLLPPLLDRLRAQGMPNYYGPQRFGHDGETVHLGLALLRGEPPPVGPSGRRLNARSPFLRKLALSAAQSALFNHYLNQRLAGGWWRRVLAGDVMAKWPFGGMFVASDLAREQERFDARETVHAGPIFGRKTFPASGEAAEREAAILADAGLPTEAFRGFGKLVQGTRRHNLVYLDELGSREVAEGVEITVTLPAGSYATVLLRELMKSTQLDEIEEHAEHS